MYRIENSVIPLIKKLTTLTSYVCLVRKWSLCLMEMYKKSLQMSSLYINVQYSPSSTGWCNVSLSELNSSGICRLISEME